MENQQINDYIRQQLAAGHSEGDLRNHLLANGWTQSAVDDAFAQYHGTNTMPSATPQPTPKKHSSKLKWMIIAGAAVVVVAIGIGIHLATSPQTLDKLATPALEQNANNTSEANDVDSIVATISEYQAGNMGSLPTTTNVGSNPQTLQVCGASCSAATAETVTLGYFKADKVVVKPYATGLSVPDSQTVYLVANATCKQGGQGIGSATDSSRAMVALYAVTAGSGLAQRCVAQ